jgi:hypothetical protein
VALSPLSCMIVPPCDAEFVRLIMAGKKLRLSAMTATAAIVALRSAVQMRSGIG